MRNKRLVLAALLLMVVSCRHAENTDISTSSPEPELSAWEKRLSEAEATLEQVMATIAKDHPEAELWSMDTEFTLTFQDRIKELNGKTAITFVEVLDAYRAGDEYRILCYDGSSYFLFRCSADQAQHIVEMLPWQSYGVVFRVTELSVTLDVLREARVDGDDGPYISEGELQPRFFLLGDCVALYDAADIPLVFWWSYLGNLEDLEGDEGSSGPPRRR